VIVDWNALGTWAAVVAALGISLKDTWQRQGERSARHLIVAGELYPAVQSLHTALAELLYDCRNYQQWDDAELLAQGNDAFESAVNHLGLEPWRARVEQPDALPEHMLFPLYKALTVLRMLMQSARVRRELQAETTLSADNEQHFLQEWVQEGASVCEALGWFVHHADKQLASLRWKHPEAALGYVVRKRPGTA
jgi:hypothetical protein